MFFSRIVLMTYPKIIAMSLGIYCYSFLTSIWSWCQQTIYAKRFSFSAQHAYKKDSNPTELKDLKRLNRIWPSIQDAPSLSDGFQMTRKGLSVGPVYKALIKAVIVLTDHTCVRKMTHRLIEELYTGSISTLGQSYKVHVHTSIFDFN